MLYSPIKVAFGGLVVWGVLWLILPLEVTGYLSPGAMVYIGLCYVALAVGVQIGANPVDRALPLPAWRLKFPERVFWTTLGIGVSGIALRIFDRAVLRGVEYGVNALDLRETLEETSVSFAGAIGAILFALCLLPLMILLVTKSDRPRFGHYAVALATFLLPMIENLAQLSRSFMLVTIGFGLGAIVIGRFRGSPFDRRILGLSLGAIVALGIASTAIFASRLDLAQRQLNDSIFESVYAENLQPNYRAKLALAGMTNPPEEELYRTILPNGMYYLSGMYEFTTLWDRPDPQPFSYGRLLFYPVVRGIEIVIPNLFGRFDEVNYVYRVGTWQTFFGPHWIDFGWYGLLVMVIIGIIVERLASAARRENLAALPIYIYMLVVIFFMPVVNLLTNGLGLFSVFGFMSFYIGLSVFKSSAVAPRGSEEWRVAGPFTASER